MVFYDDIPLIPILTKHNSLFEVLFLNNEVLIFLGLQLTRSENIQCCWLRSDILHFDETIICIIPRNHLE